MLARGSSRLPAKISAIGPLAQATTAGTSSATTTRAPAPNTASAARSVKPMPNPPISTCGFSTASIFFAASVASAASEPLRRLFISSLVPSLMENSAPRRISRNSSFVPGMRAVSILTHGIMRNFRYDQPPPRTASAARPDVEHVAVLRAHLVDPLRRGLRAGAGLLLVDRHQRCLDVGLHLAAVAA